MAGCSLHRVACKINCIREEFPFMQKSDSLLQHSRGNQYNGQLLIRKEVTRLKESEGLQLAYNWPLLMRDLRGKQLNLIESSCWMLYVQQLEVSQSSTVIMLQQRSSGFECVFVVILSCIVPQSINLFSFLLTTLWQSPRLCWAIGQWGWA